MLQSIIIGSNVLKQKQKQVQVPVQNTISTEKIMARFWNFFNFLGKLH